MIHTQEDWKLQNGINVYYIIAKDGDNHVAVALVFPRGIAGCETKGNALLMKAAPKMYEELKKAYDMGLFDGYDDEQFDAVKQILAEVEGGNDGN